VAIRQGREGDWAALTRCGDKWDACHAAAGLLRETGVFQAELNFASPSSIAVQFPDAAAGFGGLDAVRRLPGPLRLRASIDKGWRPGLYLASDAAAEEAPESRVPAEPASVVTEFAEFGRSGVVPPRPVGCRGRVRGSNASRPNQ
jgi:hypothetical protein